MSIMFWQAKLAALLLVLAGLFFAYDYVGDRAVDQYKTEQLVIKAENDRLDQIKWNKLSGELDALKNKRQENAIVRERKIEKIVERPVYINECMDDDGLRELNNAITNTGSSKAEVPTDTGY